MLINKLHWISGDKASREMLEKLNARMAEFYANMSSRQAYQELIDGAHEGNNDPTNVLANLVSDHIIAEGFGNVLEIGCGSGKIYGSLLEKNYTGRYTGIEMAEAVIEKNRSTYPQAKWDVGSVYDKCEELQSFDCCLAFFVLEHLIYPKLALQKMLGTLKPGGTLLLVFPDFSHSGIFPSQKLGWNAQQSTKDKIKAMKLADAFVSYFEGKIMRRKLKQVNDIYGPFVINTNPYCLSRECTRLIPDVDAVYLSNKNEIAQWASSQRHEVYFPFGKEGLLASQCLLAIRTHL